MQIEVKLFAQNRPTLCFRSLLVAIFYNVLEVVVCIPGDCDNLKSPTKFDQISAEIVKRNHVFNSLFSDTENGKRERVKRGDAYRRPTCPNPPGVVPPPLACDRRSVFGTQRTQKYAFVQPLSTTLPTSCVLCNARGARRPSSACAVHRNSTKFAARPRVFSQNFARFSNADIAQSRRQTQH